MMLRFTSKIIESLSNERFFSSVARDKGVSISSVTRIFDVVEMPHPTELPEIFAIDEFKGNTGALKYQCIITDPSHGQLYLSHELRQAYHLKERFYKVLDTKEPKVSSKLMGA